MRPSLTRRPNGVTGIHLRALKSAAERRVEGVEVGATDYIHTAPSSSLLCGNQPVSVVPMAFDIASRRWRDGQCDVYLHWRELVATTAAPAPAAAAPASAVSASSEAAAAAAALASAFSGGSAHVVVRRPAGRNGEQDSLAATALLSCAGATGGVPQALPGRRSRRRRPQQPHSLLASKLCLPA
jgi:hypothetical protein